jgi:hypothetical protein
MIKNLEREAGQGVKATPQEGKVDEQYENERETFFRYHGNNSIGPVGKVVY